jgi:glutamine amidotransferase
VHGCGIGWYAADKCGLVDEDGLDAYDRPTVYTTVSGCVDSRHASFLLFSSPQSQTNQKKPGFSPRPSPALSPQVAAPSHDRTLRALSKTISSSLLFGHVRAAGPGASVHQYNCHPFSKGRYMFMHNGDISGFSKIRRGLLGKLRDELFDNISGTTDSELLFHLILNELPDSHTAQDPVALQAAVMQAICYVIKANRGQPNSLNIALTDGETVIATRYRNSEHEVGLGTLSPIDP